MQERRDGSTTQILVVIDRQQHPDWTLAQIGRVEGISRERVRQILVQARLPTRAVRPAKVPRACIACGKPVPATGNLGRGVRPDHCSMECFIHHYYTIVPCDTCKLPIKLRRALVAARLKTKGQTKFYHNRTCFYAAHKGVPHLYHKGRKAPVQTICGHCSKPIQVKHSYYHGQTRKGQTAFYHKACVPLSQHRKHVQSSTIALDTPKHKKRPTLLDTLLHTVFRRG